VRRKQRPQCFGTGLTYWWVRRPSKPPPPRGQARPPFPSPARHGVDPWPILVPNRPPAGRCPLAAGRPGVRLQRRWGSHQSSDIHPLPAKLKPRNQHARSAPYPCFKSKNNPLKKKNRMGPIVGHFHRRFQQAHAPIPPVSPSDPSEVLVTWPLCTSCRSSVPVLMKWIIHASTTAVRRGPEKRHNSPRVSFLFSSHRPIPSLYPVGNAWVSRATHRLASCAKKSKRQGPKGFFPLGVKPHVDFFDPDNATQNNVPGPSVQSTRAPQP